MKRKHFYSDLSLIWITTNHMRNEESDEFIQNYVTCSIFHQAIQYVCGSNHKLNSGQRLNLNVNPLPDES
jgi:hypothetical protein